MRIFGAILQQQRHARVLVGIALQSACREVTLQAQHSVPGEWLDLYSALGSSLEHICVFPPGCSGQQAEIPGTETAGQLGCPQYPGSLRLV